MTVCFAALLLFAACDGERGIEGVVAPAMSVASTVYAVTPSSVTLQVGDTTRLRALRLDGSGRTVRVSWSSSDRYTVSVGSSGKIYAKKNGTATITAKSKYYGVSRAIVTVGSATAPTSTTSPVLTTVEVTPQAASVTAGSTVQLTATAKDQNGNAMSGVAFTWASANPSLATVSSSGLVTGVAAGAVAVAASGGDRTGSTQVTVTTGTIASTGSSAGAPPVAKGIWISKAELDGRPMSGPAWDGTGEVKHTADAAWTVQGIEVQASHVFNLQAMAGALVFARMYPDPAAETYRQKVVRAIRDVMAIPDDLSSSATAPNRNLGTWAIIADLINLPAYDRALDAQFRAWLVHKLDVPYQSGPKTIRLQAWQRPNNQGSWASYSLAAVSAYIGDQATLNRLAIRMRRYFGDVSAPHTEFVWRPQAENTFQVDPSRSSTWVGINPKGATRNGHNFDGIQPEDQGRGAPVQYDPADFPNDYSSVRYNEVSMKGLLGAVLILHRAGYRDLLAASDQALLRAARWMKYAADTFAAKGYRYFTDGNETPRPLINYFYSAGLPETRARSQLSGGAFGYTWTWWTHAGRRVN